jgi:hypothetical protein
VVAAGAPPSPLALQIALTRVDPPRGAWCTLPGTVGVTDITQVLYMVTRLRAFPPSALLLRMRASFAQILSNYVYLYHYWVLQRRMSFGTTFFLFCELVIKK